MTSPVSMAAVTAPLHHRGMQQAMMSRCSVSGIDDGLVGDSMVDTGSNHPVLLAAAAAAAAVELKLSTLDDLCPVCGDRVSGYHYGLQTCESCKGLRLYSFICHLVHLLLHYFRVICSQTNKLKTT